MAAYYNEIDPYTVQWLRNLIAAGHIAPGDVDERSIEDVRPDDLKRYTQCHFFAGVGVWSAALRAARWPDEARVWTGSCPCQPFSAAGKGAGFDDERHLWPAWFHLIGECRPPIVIGEQVASKAVEPWVDLVQADLEAVDYAFGCVPFPSAGVGAPHIRDRAYWMAHANGGAGRQGRAINGGWHSRGDAQSRAGLGGGGGLPGVLADTERWPAERQRLDVGSAARGVRSSSREQRLRFDAGYGRDVSGLADDHGRAAQTGSAIFDDEHHAKPCGRVVEGQPDTGPTNGFWRDADWLLCRDGKWRPVEPGTFPLVDGAPARVGRLRAYGNAINLEAARTFIEAAREAIGDCELL